MVPPRLTPRVSCSPVCSKTLEQAALPNVTPEQRKKMLSFVVVSALSSALG